MRRLVSIVLVITTAIVFTPAPIVAAASMSAAPRSASISMACAPGMRDTVTGICGTARDASGNALGNTQVQLRQTADGKLVANTKTAADGTFEFTQINPTKYLIEIVDNTGKIIGTATVEVVAGTTTTLTVTATAASIAAAGGAGALASLVSGASGLVLGAAVVTGAVVAIVVAKDDASPSR